MEEGMKVKVQKDGCTCWVLMRDDSAHPQGWDTAEYELVADPACPVHGKKRYPILDHEEWTGGKKD